MARSIWSDISGLVAPWGACAQAILSAAYASGLFGVAKHFPVTDERGFAWLLLGMVAVTACVLAAVRERYRFYSFGDASLIL